MGMFGSTSLPSSLSSVLILPLVQLLSQPPSALQLLDHAQALSEGRHRAESLLRLIQDSATPHYEGWRGGASPACGGGLSLMAASVQQYLRVAHQQSLMGAWLETAVGGETAASVKECDYRALLVAALATRSIGKPEALKLTLRTFGVLAEAFPSLVSQM